MKKLFIIVLLSLTAFGMQAQERSLDVSTEREEILLGEQVKMTIVLKAKATDEAQMPIIGDTLITEVEVVSRSKVDTNYTGDQSMQLELKQEFVLTSFDSGYYAIAPLTGSINEEPIESNPFLISVRTVPIDTAKGIYDIRGLAEAPFSLTEWLQEYWYWIVVGLAAIALVTILALYFSKKKPKPKKVYAAPKRPAHETALERLSKLESQKLWQAGKIKEYYSELTDILREYIEGRFHFPALEQTTDEIIATMRHVPDFHREQIDQIRRLLFLSDLVKFAKENPIGAENESNLKLVRTFIHDTKPIADKPEADNIESEEKTSGHA